MNNVNKNKLAARQEQIDIYRNKAAELRSLANSLPAGAELDAVNEKYKAAYNKSVTLFNAAMKEFNLKF